MEVKGAQATAHQVILTRGEVEFYAKRFPRSELFVVNSIRVENGGCARWQTGSLSSLASSR